MILWKRMMELQITKRLSLMAGVLFEIAGSTQLISAALNAIAAADAVTRTMFNATRAMRFKGVNASFTTAGGAAFAFTITKDTGTGAPGSGTALLTGTVALTGAANTVVSGTLIGNLDTLKLAPSDRLGVLFSGTVTGIAGLNISAMLEPA